MEQAKDDTQGQAKPPKPKPAAAPKPTTGILFLDELQEIGLDIDKVMKESCDFPMKDLTPLAPSEVKEIFDGFKEVNQTFFDLLEKLKITDAFQALLEKVTKGFSVIAAI